ncbi:MAG: hypothetical protein K8R36_25515 [Planctomycetales bacterium]|nr:hypothetical protein [Planctomycetales bacterium]
MKRKLWQFRLRSLFILLFLSAVMAAWWSHRSHCLERAEFHHEQAKGLIWDIVKAEFEAESAAAEHQFNALQEELQKRRSKANDFYDESVPEQLLVSRAISDGYLLAPVDEEPLPQSEVPPQNGSAVDATAQIESSPSALAAIAPSASPKQIAWETRARALRERSAFHTQQKERYLRTIYRPWMNRREPQPPEVPAEPK